MELSNTSCTQPLINARLPATISVRAFCLLTMVFCGWALINLKQCCNCIRVVTSLAVGQALLLHICVAFLSIIGITITELNNPSKAVQNRAITTYLWLTALSWQEHIAYLLLALISVFQGIMYDFAILYIVVSLGMSSTPTLAMVLNHFKENRPAITCDHNLWHTDSSDVNRLPVMIPSIAVLSLATVLVGYEAMRQKMKFQQMHPTCPKCPECAMMQVSVTSWKLSWQLVVQFLLCSLPRVVYWCVSYSSPSSNIRDYEWLALTAQGMSGSLGGLITLLTQWQLITIRVFPCYNATTLADDGDEQNGVRLNRTALTTDKFWNCLCQHCTEHKLAAENEAVRTITVQADAAFRNTAKTSIASSLNIMPSRKGLLRPFHSQTTVNSAHRKDCTSSIIETF